jgi:Zn-dependent protease with chaperone function
MNLSVVIHSLYSPGYIQARNPRSARSPFARSKVAASSLLIARFFKPSRAKAGVKTFCTAAIFALALPRAAFAAGYPPCTAQNGQAVAVYKTTDTSAGPAYSTIVNSQPVIVFNEELMSQYAHSGETRLFIYFHECGHQALGHTTEQSKSKKHTNEQELEADCFAAKHLRAMGATEQNMSTVVEDLKLLRKDPDHPGHVKRIENALACFRQG